MSKRSDTDLLADIKEAIHRIGQYLEKRSYSGFLNDTKTQDAVVRNIEIIGEASKNVSPQLKQKYPQIAWKKIAGARDRLIHHYFGVNYDIVWTIAKEELPELLIQIETISKRKKLN